MTKNEVKKQLEEMLKKINMAMDADKDKSNWNIETWHEYPSYGKLVEKIDVFSIIIERY
jgi:hypothetical protein